MTTKTAKPKTTGKATWIARNLYLKTTTEKETGRFIGASYIFRYTMGGLVRERGIGVAKRLGVPGLTENKAKQIAAGYTGKVLAGEDPFGTFVAQKSFGTVADMLIERGMTGKNPWTRDANGKCGTAEDWQRMLREAPTLARMNFSHPEIEQQVIKELGRPGVWGSKKGEDWLHRMNKVFRVARRLKLFTRDNPCDREAIVDILGDGRDGRGKEVGGDVEHFVSMAHAEVETFLNAVAKRKGKAALAIRFLVLTSARPGNVVYARKSCIDRAARTWTVPADGHTGERMKAGVEHTYWLNDQAMAMVDALWDNEGDFLFPGTKEGKPINEGALGDLMNDKRPGKGGMALDAVPHGFRSTFADFVTAFHPELKTVADAMLAHAEGKVAAAYFRNSDTLGQVKYLSQVWGNYCVGVVRPVSRPKLVTVGGMPVSEAA